MHFARLLRRAGLPVGPSEARAALRALTLVDIGSRADVRTALRATMTRRHEHQEVFDAAFDLFWRDPEATRHAAAMGMLAPRAELSRDKPPPASRRVAEAFQPPRDRPLRPEERPPQVDEFRPVHNAATPFHLPAASLSCVLVSKSLASWRSCNWLDGSPVTRLTIRPRWTAGRLPIASAQRWRFLYS
jgi:uncharacterized protein with von Willebrand factor type A (vWA) domain